MVEVIGLKIITSRPLEQHHLPTKFHENLPICSKVISGGGYRERETYGLVICSAAQND
jgi:hypothetical protein